MWAKLELTKEESLMGLYLDLLLPYLKIIYKGVSARNFSIVKYLQARLWSICPFGLLVILGFRVMLLPLSRNIILGWK